MTYHIDISGGYHQVSNLLVGKYEIRIAHNTRLRTAITGPVLLYHGNPIVRWRHDGSIILDSCGWRTATTKMRIGWALPHGWLIYQEHYDWFIAYPYLGEVYKFGDGMILRDNQVYLS